MSPKQSLKERAWGTRYDTLDSSPPVSPPAKHLPSPITIPHSPVTSVVLAYDSKDTDHEGSVKSPAITKPDKVPHDASIFVGSLPTYIEHSELVRLLHEHLSEHTEVKAVKVIRDNKGGVCAFVQCEDAYVAGCLLRTLHSLPPRPFFGRILRFELARALRTLLISYRSPNQLVLSADMEDGLNANGGQAAPMEPATAMRLYRHRNAKALVVLYNEEAQKFDSEAGAAYTTDVDSSDAFSGAGLLLSPLRYDAETLHELVDAFGSIEYFTEYKHDEQGERQDSARINTIRPHPHDAPRSAGMDMKIYEVKWSHRDDCVSALMTLRRVPHLSISWAHHSSTFGRASESRNSSPALIASAFSPYNTRIYHRPHVGNGIDYQRQGDSRGFSSHGRIISTQSRTSTANTSGDPSLSPHSTFAHSTPFLHAPSSPLTPWSTSYQAKSPRWSPRDFPPLGDRPAGEHIFSSHKTSQLWGDRVINEEETGLVGSSIASDSPSSSLSVNASTPLVQPIADPIEDVAGVASSSLPVQSRCGDSGSREADVMPPTPDFSTSPITPLTPRTGHNFPQTPTSAISSTAFGDSQSFYGESDLKGVSDLTTPQSPGRCAGRDGRLDDTGRELDPTTIFVGGLEMFGTQMWTEAQLHDLFGKFGQIEDIQLVRPLNKRTAFAFIRFNNTEAPARAVLEEHNRVYRGRHIRVQLRDNNPPQRSPWRYGRGRGRFHHAGLPRLHVDLDGNQREDQIVEIGESFAALSSSYSSEIQGSFQAGRDDGNRPHAELSGQATYPTAEPGSTSTSSSVTNVSSSQFDVTNDLSTATVASFTPPPSTSSVGPSASVTGSAPQYTMPSFGYYGPQPWFQAYSHYPYPIPFLPGYAGYAPPSVQQGPRTFGSTDTSNSSAGTQSVWNTTAHMYKPMVPYMSYPLLAFNSEQRQSHATQQSNMQPPLRPTGFMQGSQGTLIPVYHPEALNQYMSHSQHSTPPPHVPVQTQPAASWPGYQTLSMYPYTVPTPSMGPSPSQDAQTAQQNGWIPTPAAFGYPPSSHQVQSNNTHPYLLQAPPSGTGTIAPSFHGSYQANVPNMHRHDNRNTPPPRRYNRRENYHAVGHNSDRMNPSRASPNRFQPTPVHSASASCGFVGPSA